MRDLKRANAKLPAYLMLRKSKFEVFIPMKEIVSKVNDKNIRKKVPFMQDLLFVHSTRELLDPIVEKTNTLQYRYQKGFYKEPIVVNEQEMNRFIAIVESSETTHYYQPSEITNSMLGSKIRIIGGLFNTYEGYLLSTRGSIEKSLLVYLDNFLAASVEVNPELIELIKE